MWVALQDDDELQLAPLSEEPELDAPPDDCCSSSIAFCFTRKPSISFCHAGVGLGQ